MNSRARENGSERVWGEGFFSAYAVGLIYASVCTDLDDATATELLNVEHWTGIESRWRIVDEAFANGSPNPCPCPDRPDCRHILFSC